MCGGKTYVQQIKLLKAGEEVARESATVCFENRYYEAARAFGRRERALIAYRHDLQAFLAKRTPGKRFDKKNNPYFTLAVVPFQSREYERARDTLRHLRSQVSSVR